MNYEFIPKDKENSKPPTIQERFIEIYFEQDNTLKHNQRYWSACSTFTSQYNLQPPYTDPSSFKVMLTYRRNNGNTKK